MLNEEIDPRGCRSTNNDTVQELHGICEVSTRFYEELIFTATNLSETCGALHRHYKVLADASYASGAILQDNRNNMRHDRCLDTLRMINFDTAKDILRHSLRYSDV